MYAHEMLRSVARVCGEGGRERKREAFSCHSTTASCHHDFLHHTLKYVDKLGNFFYYIFPSWRNLMYLIQYLSQNKTNENEISITKMVYSATHAGLEETMKCVGQPLDNCPPHLWYNQSPFYSMPQRLLMLHKGHQHMVAYQYPFPTKILF